MTTFALCIRPHSPLDKKYEIEAEAMLAGMRKKGIDLYAKILDREIDATDILILSSVFDLSHMVFPTMKVYSRLCKHVQLGNIDREGPDTKWRFGYYPFPGLE